VKALDVDLLIVGAGPVGLMCSYLATLSGLTSVIVDGSKAPIEAGRADALNARTLQLLHVAKLFDEVYPFGKPCNTSSVWSKGRYVSRQSSWWDSLEGCFHKHFLMIGQSHIEKLLDRKLIEQKNPVRRSTLVQEISVTETGCLSTLSDGTPVHSKFVIGADGSRSFVRDLFNIPFSIVRPQIVWAVVDAEIETDFDKVPEIIVFQNETSDVAWIPREGSIDRFYVQMEEKDFVLEDAVEKIKRALNPHTFSLKRLDWFSRFSVKESVAEHFSVKDRIFLAGDAAHIHSVNGGQGLNTGLSDAFNLIWKLALVVKNKNSLETLKAYEQERKPVAESVILSSGELVRSTKFSEDRTHAENYVKLVEKHAGNITGMGISYGEEGLKGTRLFDQELDGGRLYDFLDYRHYTLLIFGHHPLDSQMPSDLRIIMVSEPSVYSNKVLLVRPDTYIHSEHSNVQEAMRNYAAIINN
jgi:2-polyprenyl-6-methoxyphenol hydroxylase-like FAD-dependent oxidoreductase